MKLRVMTVVGTRPEIIRLSATIRELNKHTNHFLVHTGQNYDYELNEVFFNELNIPKPDKFLGINEQSPIKAIGRMIASIEDCILEFQPEAFLVLGDTNSCLTSIAAKRLKVPIFHMEAGNRCFDSRVPEEINRKIVDCISDINLPYSSISREYLLREGFPPDRIIKTGSPMFEVIHDNLESIHASRILQKLGLTPQSYLLVSCHREENVDSDKKNKELIDCLNKLAIKYKKKILFSLHPRTKKRIAKYKKSLHPNIILNKPFGYFDYMKLQIDSFVTLSDSGTISEESSILDFPAINIREAHERPEAMEEANVIMTGFNAKRIIQSINLIRSEHNSINKIQINPVDYRSPNVSKKIVKLIHSYVDYINLNTWKKNS